MTNLLARIFSRRKSSIEIEHDRRKPARTKDAEQIVENAVDRLDRTIRMRREDLLK